ncbi:MULTISPECIES: IclR family transcriptional regulator [unclassified Mesorhizobium]|mgnify:FL=1|uniref:IclR family transcriptional regulator n=1 Tax=unclassified Mesorhizobium TaxID=325217 RepID=UPI00086D2479|nr:MULTISPECIES: IclR family transcriptional regulator [unclassified Mesorhizobium]ODT13044.1 MAG: IclR family transcriptional regulator [Mesorhizobium sp. SCN 65-12]OJX81976.1 MAG: IclR family transcriptional regulator [Mesorhizobium sp. 65-26]
MSTVAKAVSLLEHFTLGEPEIGLSDIARKAGLDKATTRRLLVALAGHRLIEQEPQSRRYRLGAGLSRLARIREAHFPFTRLAVPIVRELAQETGETVHISEFSAGALLTAHVELSAKANRVNVDVGQVLPLHGTASGIAFLAASSDEAVKAYVEKPLQAFTQHTVTARAKVLEAIRLAAARGYSRSLQGYEEGVHSVAAAVICPDGHPIGTISVASPISRVDDAAAAAQGEAACRAARKISARLSGEA